MVKSYIEGVIFDLGKTLMYIPDEFKIEFRISNLLKKTEEEVEFLIYDLCNRYLKMSPEEFIERLCQRLINKTNSGIKKSLRDICMKAIEQARLQDDAIEVLLTLKKRGYKLSLVSNTSPLSKLCIRKLGLINYFDHVVFSCDIGYLKPDPRIFMYAIKLMETEPQRTCIVGDRIRTLILGGAIIKSKLVFVERRTSKTIISEQIPVEAIIPNLYELIKLPMFCKFQT